MVDAGTLHLGLLGGARRHAVEVIPLRLPDLKGDLRRLDARAGGLATLLRLGQGGLLFSLTFLQFGQGALITRQQPFDLSKLPLKACQLLLLAAAVLTGKLDALFEAGDLRPHAVVMALNPIEGLRGVREGGTPLLDVRLQVPLPGRVGGKSGFPFAEHLITFGQFQVQGTPAQGLNLRTQEPLFLLEAFVLFRRGGLALQMQQLFGDLFAQVVEAIQIFPGVADAGLRLAAALLVLGDARRLLQEEAQILGARLDEAGDHALLDDGVAARSQAGAKEQILDIPPPAAGAVKEVIGLTVAADLALDGDLGILGVLPPSRAIAIVEEEFDAGQADGLAAGGAVEDDVGHGLAAQHLGRGLTHDPTHGIDDIRLAAAIGADDTAQIARKKHGGGVHEGLETGKFDLFQAHRGKIQDPGCQGKATPAPSWSAV